MSTIVLTGQTQPSNPTSGKLRFYVDSSDGVLKSVNSSGTIVSYGGSLSQEQIQDIVGSLVSNTSTITWTYNDAGNALYADVNEAALNISTIPNSPSGNLVSINVQDALNELQGDIDAINTTPQVIRVKLNNPSEGEFTSLSAAVASITDADPSTKPYIIEIGAGVFTVNNPIVLPAGVSVKGQAINTTSIVPQNVNQHLFVLGNMSEISFLNLVGGAGSIGSGKAAIYAEDIGEFGQLHKISIYDFDIGIDVYANTTDAVMYAEYCDVNGDFTYGVRARANSSLLNRTQLENFYTYPSTATNPIHTYGTGLNTELIINSAGFIGADDNIGVQVENGTELHISDVFFRDFTNTNGIAINIPNTGAGPDINISIATFEGNTKDLQINHSLAFGSATLTADTEKVFNDDNNTVTIKVLDNNLGGMSFNGPLNYSSTEFSRIANIGPLVTTSSTMGVYEGGNLSVSSGLTLAVSALKAYVSSTTTDDVYHYVQNSQNILLTANSNLYIYLNNSGVLTANTSFPDTRENVLLGRAITNSTDIIYIEKAKLDSHHYNNNIDRMFREALGPIYATGSATSESGTRQLNITAGEYYYSQNEFTPTGGSTISWDSYYKSTTPGVYTRVTGVSTVDNGFYDDGSGTLAAIPNGKHAKHLLLLIGGPSEKYALVYGTAIYDSVSEAETAPLPILPSFMSGAFVKITSLVVGPHHTNIPSILDERPRIGFASSSSFSSGGVTDHGALTGLADNDHPQYLLRDGSNPMTNDLDMGGNSLTNVILVDGVDVSTHASRHLPNGADALATGTPSNIGTTNSEGIANAFARQDHVHAHGSQTDGTLHAEATTSVSGFMSSSDKTKLDTVTQTELGYLSGVTSSIQTQLDGKQPTGNYITALTGDVTATGPGSVTATLSNTGVTAGTYLNALITVDAKGRITSASPTKYTYVMTAAQSTTNTNYNQGIITELTTVSLPTGNYKFTMHGLFQTAATTTGIGVRIENGTAAISTIYGKWFIKQAADGTAANFQYDQLAANTNVTSASVLTANSNQIVTGEGFFTITTAGTMRIAIRTEVNASAASLQPGSMLIVEAL